MTIGVFSNYLQIVSLPPVILLPAYGLGNAVHSLATVRHDVSMGCAASCYALSAF